MNQGLKMLWLAACCSSTLSLAQAADGEKWKVSSSMQMGGMTIPSRSTEICKQPGDGNVPMETRKDCEMYDVSRTGNVQSFKMRCTGKEAMEASGQFTYLGPDHYQGKMQMSVQGQTMNMSLEGQKLGKCDGGELNLKAKQMAAQAQQQIATANQSTADMCRKSAAEASSPALFTSMCKDPADVKTYCAAVQTPERIQSMAETEKRNVQAGAAANIPGMKPLTESAQLCGFNAEQLKTKFCATAEASGKLGFLATQCPAQAAVLARAQCAGRAYTSISDKYRDFCSSYMNALGSKASGRVSGN